MATDNLMFAEGKITGRTEACEAIRNAMTMVGIGEAERTFGEFLISIIEPPEHMRGE